MSKTALESLTEEVKQRVGNPGYKLLKGSQIWNLIKSKFFFDIAHKVNKFYKISIVCTNMPFNKTSTRS